MKVLLHSLVGHLPLWLTSTVFGAKAIRIWIYECGKIVGSALDTALLQNVAFCSGRMEVLLALLYIHYESKTVQWGEPCLAFTTCFRLGHVFSFGFY